MNRFCFTVKNILFILFKQFMGFLIFIRREKDIATVVLCLDFGIIAVLQSRR